MRTYADVCDVAQVLPHIMESLFAVMDEVGSDELVQSLDVLIEIFASRMPPYAQGLCHRLSETFLRLAASDDADTDSSLAARSLLLTQYLIYYMTPTLTRASLPGLYY